MFGVILIVLRSAKANRANADFGWAKNAAVFAGNSVNESTFDANECRWEEPELDKKQSVRHILDDRPRGRLDQ
jgi:hypothetical protein